MLQEEEQAILEAFRPFFEDAGIKKVWHNYSFDRHVMSRMVRCLPSGFVTSLGHLTG